MKNKITLTLPTILIALNLNSQAAIILPSDLGFGIAQAGDKITGLFDVSTVTGVAGCELFLGTDGPFVNSTGTGWELGVDNSSLSDNFSLHVNSADAIIRITMGSIFDPGEDIISSLPLIGNNPDPSVFDISSLQTSIRIENTSSSAADWGSPLVFEGSDPSSIFPGDWVRADFAALVSNTPNTTATPVTIEILKPIPEPTSIALTLIGLGALTIKRKRN